MHPIREFTIDHIVPRARGGTDDSANLVAACWDCNFRKRARLPKQQPQQTTLITPAQTEEADWMTVAEVAELLKVDQETVRRLVKRGELAALDLGSRKMGYRIRRDDLDAFIMQRFCQKTQ